MRKLLLASLVLWALNSNAQSSLDVGYNLGFSSYLGDLQPLQYTYQNSNLAMGVQGNYNYKKYLSVGVFVNYGTMQADDRNSKIASHVARNLSFRSGIFEMGANMQLNILPFVMKPNKHKEIIGYRCVPYVYGGLALFSFNPRAYYNGQYIDLRPLGTEGQNIPLSNKEPYALTQVSIPFGLGVKYAVNKKVYLSLSFGWRKTFTDYLDDVSGTYWNLSELKGAAADLAFRGDELAGFNGKYPKIGTQRGDSGNDDWYLMNMFTLHYCFDRKK